MITRRILRWGVSWIIPKCDHNGPHWGGRVDVTTEEYVRDVMVEKQTVAMCSEDEGRATDEEHRQH